MLTLSLRQRLKKIDAGFTVVEVVMATFILVLGILSSIVVLQSSLRALDTARNTTLASQIMQSEMERIRLLSWSGVAALPASASINFDQIFPVGTIAQKARERIARIFTITRTSTDVTGKEGEMKQITVTVTWRGIDGASHTRTTSTQYAKDGLYDYYYTKARS